MIDIKERLRAFDSFAVNPKICKEAADHIEQLEAEIARLHSSLAGAVQHGEQGWQRYESANRMCMNQQNEIARLNNLIKE